MAGGSLSRRRLLSGTAVVAGAALLGRAATLAGAAEEVDVEGVAVLPRSTWGAGLPPKGTLALEGEVRYLLVHHSVDPGDDYTAADVPNVLRAFYRAHTAPARGWPDLAYNFLVDRFGRVWEGRAGSAAGPVAGDATGGNQGWDQLCCFIGDHQRRQPSAEALAAMGSLLGALARRYGIPVGEGATATFVSRGSNLHPPGAEVTTSTIAGHREMSRTACPGDLVVARLPELRALAARGAAAPTPAPATTTPPTTAAPPPTTARPGSTTTPPEPGPTTPAAPPAPPGATPTPTPGAAAPAPPGPTGDGGIGTIGRVVGAGAAAAAAAASAAAAARRIRAGRPPVPPGEGPPR